VETTYELERKRKTFLTPSQNGDQEGVGPVHRGVGQRLFHRRESRLAGRVGGHPEWTTDGGSSGLRGDRGSPCGERTVPPPASCPWRCSRAGGRACDLRTHWTLQLRKTLQKTWWRQELKGEEKVARRRRRWLGGVGVSPREVRVFKEDGGVKK
jgi:hypothetical protein